MSQAAERIVDFIVNEIMDGECDFDVAAEENLLLSGSLDSLGVMRLVTWMEHDLGVAVPPEDVTLENFQSVSAMAAYVEARR